MWSKSVEATHSPTYVTNDVGKETRLKNHGDNYHYSLIGGDWVEISIANRACCCDDPI